MGLIDPPKRGFNGRPLVALLVAMGMGILASYVALWWRLDGQTVSWVFCAILMDCGFSLVSARQHLSSPCRTTRLLPEG